MQKKNFSAFSLARFWHQQQQQGSIDERERKLEDKFVSDCEENVHFVDILEAIKKFSSLDFQVDKK